MTAPKGEGFPKAARIRRRREFLSFGRAGEKRRTESFVCLTERCARIPRLGITVSRKVGGAVVRNRLKRRIREIYRRNPDRACLEHDLIVIARVGAGSLTSAAIGRALAVSLRHRDVGSSPRASRA
jgi:ribonuclease P protein component